MDWQTVEMNGYAYYSQKGYRILISLVYTKDYDFVAEKDGKYIRVNVKKAGLKNKRRPNSWSISRSSMDYFSIVDVYLAWLPHLEKYIELSGDFFKESNSKSKLIPKNMII